MLRPDGQVVMPDLPIIEALKARLLGAGQPDDWSKEGDRLAVGFPAGLVVLAAAYGGKSAGYAFCSIFNT